MSPGPPSVPGAAGTNLYVKGLPLSYNHQQVIELFSGFGNVVSAKVLNAKPGCADGAAMVMMASPEEAEKAIAELNGVPLKGGDAHLLQAKFHGHSGPSDNIFVKGLPPSTTQDELVQACSQFGTVVSTKLMPKPGMPDLAALVRFSSVEEATLAIEMLNGQSLPGAEHTLIVRQAADTPRGKLERDGGKGRSEPHVVAPVRHNPQFAAKAEHGHARGGGGRSGGGWSGSGKGPPAWSGGGGLTGPGSWPPSRVGGSHAAMPSGGGSSGGVLQCKYHGDGQTPSDNMFIKGLPSHTSETDIRQFCSEFGHVTSVKLLPKPGAPGAALVRFSSVHEATAAINGLHGRGGGGGCGGYQGKVQMPMRTIGMAPQKGRHSPY